MRINDLELATEGTPASAVQILDEEAHCARAPAAERLETRQPSGGPEDMVRLSAAVVQMRAEILDLNRALKSAYDQQSSSDSEEVLRLREQVTHLSAAVDALHKSASWRITAPLRRIYDVFKGKW